LEQFWNNFSGFLLGTHTERFARNKNAILSFFNNVFFNFKKLV